MVPRKSDPLDGPHLDGERLVKLEFLGDPLNAVHDGGVVAPAEEDADLRKGEPGVELGEIHHDVPRPHRGGVAAIGHDVVDGDDVAVVELRRVHQRADPGRGARRLGWNPTVVELKSEQHAPAVRRRHPIVRHLHEVASPLISSRPL